MQNFMNICKIAADCPRSVTLPRAKRCVRVGINTQSDVGGTFISALSRTSQTDVEQVDFCPHFGRLLSSLRAAFILSVGGFCPHFGQILFLFAGGFYPHFGRLLFLSAGDFYPLCGGRPLLPDRRRNALYRANIARSLLPVRARSGAPRTLKSGKKLPVMRGASCLYYSCDRLSALIKSSYSERGYAMPVAALSPRTRPQKLSCDSFLSF